ncbi:hypothetical protein Syun_028597 [Stephania yunnanensis]|uniref:BED-type domain-containing protein n=1 Tax=Stephania yunnanensis TaxID=152371 RepID=A0AAP0HFB3_9MAGN
MVEEMAPLRSTGFVDPGWQHGIAQDDKKKKVKCNYCGKIVSGGIFRLKQHLAGISGQVTHCSKAPDDVQMKMKENLEGSHSIRRHRQPEDGLISFDLHSNGDDGEEEEPIGYKLKGKQAMLDKNLVMALPPLRSLGYVDPGWEHGVAQDDKKKKVKCNYCEKVISGGINRFKQHLAKIPGEVASCKNAPDDVYLKIKENMKWHRTGRRNRRPEAQDIAAVYITSDHEEDDHEEDPLLIRNKETFMIADRSYGKEIRKRPRTSPGVGSELSLKRPKLDYVNPKAQKGLLSPSYKQVKVRTGFDKKNCKDVLSAICKFFYHAAIPLSAASSPYFYKMLELVGQYGQGLIGPSSQMISGQFLQDEISTIKEYFAEFKASWTVTGCTVMADSWKDAQGRTLINFLVSCPRGTSFVSSIDATDIIEDAASLFKLLDSVVEEIGEENVVQVITENTNTYKIAGKMLEEKRKSLFWTPCAAYCIDRVLEDFMKIKWIGECMEKGKRITKFIYNRAWLLNIMKKEFTGGREILRPAVTKYATSFTTLQSLLDHRTGLKRMFQSSNWHSSHYARSDDGKEVEKIVTNPNFWKKMQYVRKSVDPIMQVLQQVESDGGLSMPSVYNDIYRAKLAIKSVHGDDMRKYRPFWSAIDNHLNSLFDHPLYLAAYFLNPSFHYRPDCLANPDFMRGLNQCIVRLEPDNGRRISASMKISDFMSAKADFGTELARSTRSELDPAAWWQQHGINCLELQRIAVRILSQTCSTYGCDHNWSAFDQIHTKRQNHLAQKRLNELVYVHYNLRLRERQFRRKNESPLSLDDVLLESQLDEWTVETQALQEDEEILDMEMEQPVGYENQVYENEVVNTDSRKGTLDMVALTSAVEPIDDRPATDDDIDLDFLDDD